MTNPAAGPTAPLVPSAGEVLLLDRMMSALRNDEQVILLLGSGVSARAIPGVTGVLEIADHYAAGRSDDGTLRRALAQARDEVDPSRPIDVYRAYRRVFADWVSGGEFDVIAQQAVLRAYRAPDPLLSPLATHGLWQHMELSIGERAENDRYCWRLPRGVEAAGHLLARMGEAFDHHVLTTNFDPLLEIAIRSANGTAVSLPLDADGGYGASMGADGAVRVFHLHGFWRPTLHVQGPRLLLDPNLLTGDPARLLETTAALITGDTVCVLGASDWAGTLSGAIAAVARVRPIQVLWGLGSDDEQGSVRRSELLSRTTGTKVECFPGVDTDRLLPLLAERAGVSIPPRTTGQRHRVRHHTWERELVSQPDAVPPPDVPGLLLQLERRFGWVTEQPGPAEPTRLLWPVRLRARASVIHMVQAFVAGALARLGVQVRVCLDDVGSRDTDTLDVFRGDLDRWMNHTGHGADREFVLLSEFVDEHQRRPRPPSPESLLRPTDPWSVARAFYGEHNPSLYSILAAVKAVPNMTTWDALEKEAWPIVQALLRTDANRLLTPLTLWSFLHDMLLENSTSDVMTLGGRDEAIFWAQWRQTFGLGVGQLYNPHIKNLSHTSQMLRWSSRPELRLHLQRTRELPGWDAEGSYVPWLFQNALLLPIYLNRQPVPEIGEFPLDSWAAFVAAIQDGAPALDLLTDRVTDLYLGG
jgi:hypothetical protein